MRIRDTMAVRGDSALADDRDRLDLHHHFRFGETGDGDQGARGKAAFEILLADFDEAIAVARIDDEHRHGDDVLEPAAGLLQRVGDVLERLMHLGIEIAGERAAVIVLRGAVSGHPDHAPALGEYRGRERPVLLPAAFDITPRHASALPITTAGASKTRPPISPAAAACRRMGDRLTQPTPVLIEASIHGYARTTLNR